MEISKKSWHYRLWQFLVKREGMLRPSFLSYNSQTNGDWDEKHIPTSLCPYVNRLAFYFLMQIPFVVALFAVAFFVISMLLAVNLKAAYTLLMYGFAPFIAKDVPVDLAVGFFMLMVETVVATIFAIVKINKWYRRKYYWSNTSTPVDRVLDAVSDSVSVFVSPITGTWRLVSAYMSAHHDKVCPSLTFTDNTEAQIQREAEFNSQIDERVERINEVAGDVANVDGRLLEKFADAQPTSVPNVPAAAKKKKRFYKPKAPVLPSNK